MLFNSSVLSFRGARVAALAAATALLLGGSLTSVRADPGDPGDPDALLRIYVEVTNDDGGTATPGDFQVEVEVNGAVSLHNAGDEVAVPVGELVWLHHVGNPGYENVSIVCLSPGVINPTGQFTAADGTTFSCTFTYDDQPPPAGLTVIKEVINDDGGVATPADFELLVKQETSEANLVSGDAVDLYAKVPTWIGEKPFSGYTQVSLVCLDSTGHSVFVDPLYPLPGESYTCTITNDDDPPADPTPPVTPTPTKPPVTTITPTPKPTPPKAPSNPGPPDTGN